MVDPFFRSSLLFGLCLSRSSLSLQNPQDSLVFLGGDLAAGEAFPEDLLRRVPGCLQAVVCAASGEDARHDPGYEGQDSTPEQDGKEYPRPPGTARARPAPVVPAPVGSILKQKGGEHPRFRENVHHVVHRGYRFLSSDLARSLATKTIEGSNPTTRKDLRIATGGLPVRTPAPPRLPARNLRSLSAMSLCARPREISRTLRHPSRR